jgi:hypothetical protein
MEHCRYCAIPLVIVLFAGAAVAAAGESGLQVGAAKVDYTPSRPPRSAPW